MKTLLRAATALAVLALATPALAQQAAQQRTTTGNQPQIGLGVGITSGEDAPGMGYLLFVPINLGNLRVEPFLGWQRSDTDAAGKDSDILLGVGGFFVQPTAAQLQLYAGGRLASRWVSHKDAAFGAAGTDKQERRDTILALAAGGEYLPIPRVALGAEFQLGYVSVGDTKFTDGPTGQTAEGGGGSGTFTQATLFARIYLF